VGSFSAGAAWRRGSRSDDSAPGVGSGPDHREEIPAERITSELERFRAARERAREEIHTLRERVRRSLGDTCAGCSMRSG